MVHPKVQQEASDSRNDQEGCHRKAFQPQRWHAVDGAQEEPKAVELCYETAKLCGNNC